MVLVPEERVAQEIFVLRGHKVILDSDLAKLYGVLTKSLNLAVSRNRKRFPADFMFQLTPREYQSLRFQFATSNTRGGRRYLPYVFTEHGALMLGNVLKSQRAMEISIIVVRAFVRMRQLLSTNIQLSHKLEELDRRVGAHDKNIRDLVLAIRRLMSQPEPKRVPIGFGQSRKERV